jgi:hypothetical protein
MWPGVIFAATVPVGEEAKRALGLRHWIVATPKRLVEGHFRGSFADPHLLLVHDPAHGPVGTLMLENSHRLADLFNNRLPDTWTIQR